MTTLPPGYTNTGYKCEHCIKSQQKYKTFCSIPSHHKTRVMKAKTKSKSSKSTLETITLLTKEYSASKLIVATVLLFPQIETIEDVMKFSSRVKTSQLNSYLVNFHLTQDSKLANTLDLAKSITQFFPNLQEVKLLKKTICAKQKWTVDLVTRNLQNQLSGIIIPHHYYLVRLPIQTIINLTPEDTSLKDKLLAEFGFNKYYYPPLVTDSNAKDAMSYAPGKNAYWERIIHILHQNKNAILGNLVRILTFPQESYPIYLLNKKGISQIINTNVGWDITLDTEYTRKSSLRLLMTHNQNLQYSLYIGWEKNFNLDPQITIMKK